MKSKIKLPSSWQTITENSEKNFLDFSVNINPLGIPETVKQQLSNLADIAGVYPDTDCKYLSYCLAEKYNINADTILCGNGADDLLYRLAFALKPKHAVIIEPTFEEYNRALELVGCEVQHYMTNAKNNFILDEGILSAVQSDCDILFLCNPNNPTGQLIKPQLLHKIIKLCCDKNILLFADECFMEFIPDWEKYTIKTIASQSNNIIVTDAFTKTYSLAGFRLGFCISGNQKLLSDMKLYGQDFAVSTPAQLTGISALADSSYMQNTYSIISQERKYLLSELQKLPIEVYPSYGNFMLLKTEYKNICQRLLEKGIKVRDCSKFYGLGPECCRIAVRLHDENATFIKVLHEIL